MKYSVEVDVQEENPNRCPVTGEEAKVSLVLLIDVNTILECCSKSTSVSILNISYHVEFEVMAAAFIFIVFVKLENKSIDLPFTLMYVDETC